MSASERGISIDPGEAHASGVSLHDLYALITEQMRAQQGVSQRLFDEPGDPHDPRALVDWVIHGHDLSVDQQIEFHHQLSAVRAAGLVNQCNRKQVEAVVSSTLITENYAVQLYGLGINGWYPHRVESDFDRQEAIRSMQTAAEIRGIEATTHDITEKVDTILQSKEGKTGVSCREIEQGLQTFPIHGDMLGAFCRMKPAGPDGPKYTRDVCPSDCAEGHGHINMIYGAAVSRFLSGDMWTVRKVSSLSGNRMKVSIYPTDPEGMLSQLNTPWEVVLPRIEGKNDFMARRLFIKKPVERFDAHDFIGKPLVIEVANITDNGFEMRWGKGKYKEQVTQLGSTDFHFAKNHADILHLQDMTWVTSCLPCLRCAARTPRVPMPYLDSHLEVAPVEHIYVERLSTQPQEQVDEEDVYAIELLKKRGIPTKRFGFPVDVPILYRGKLASVQMD